MNKEHIQQWLEQENEQKLQELWSKADEIRKQTVADQVHLRGLIEISNHCIRQCTYCGLRSAHKDIERYRMTRQEIIDCAMETVDYGYGTIVMQAGEDYGIKAAWLAEIIKTIKSKTKLAVTLSLGERPDEDFVLWRQAGADRYLIRFETTDQKLYQQIHPPLPNQTRNRFDILHRLKELGYEAGSGVMIGIPGQTYESLANDIYTFKELDLDMIGVGPYIAHPDTPLAQQNNKLNTKKQVPNTELMVYKVLALTRIVCPEANIPSTTALATINRTTGRELGLSRGANVVMPNITPTRYRKLYEIYPGKACLNETAQQCQGCMRKRIESIGRTIGTGPGFRVRRVRELESKGVRE